MLGHALEGNIHIIFAQPNLAAAENAHRFDLLHRPVVGHSPVKEAYALKGVSRTLGVVRLYGGGGELDFFLKGRSLHWRGTVLRQAGGGRVFSPPPRPELVFVVGSAIGSPLAPRVSVGTQMAIFTGIS